MQNSTQRAGVKNSGTFWKKHWVNVYTSEQTPEGTEDSPYGVYLLKKFCDKPLENVLVTFLTLKVQNNKHLTIENIGHYNKTGPWQGSTVGQGTVLMHQSCWFGLRSGHVQDSTSKCTNKWDNKLMFLSFSYPLPHSL